VLSYETGCAGDEDARRARHALNPFARSAIRR
jgi:hypothetical protein